MHAMMGGTGAFCPKSVNGKLFGVFVFRREIGFGDGVMDGCGILGCSMTESQITKPQQGPATSTWIDLC